MTIRLSVRAYLAWASTLEVAMITAFCAVHFLTPLRLGWGWWVIGFVLVPLAGSWYMVHRAFVKVCWGRYPDRREATSRLDGIDRIRGFNEAVRQADRFLPYTNPLGWLSLIVMFLSGCLIGRGWSEVERSNHVLPEEHG